MHRIYEKFIAWASLKKFVIVLFAELLLLMVIIPVIIPAFKLLAAGYDPFCVQNDLRATDIYQQLPYYTLETIRLADLIIAFDLLYFLFQVFGSLLLWAWLFRINPLPIYDTLAKNHLFGLGVLSAVVALCESGGFLFLIHAYPNEFMDMARHACFLKKAKVIMAVWGLNILTIIFIIGNIMTRIVRSRRRYW